MRTLRIQSSLAGASGSGSVDDGGGLRGSSEAAEQHYQGRQLRWGEKSRDPGVAVDCFALPAALQLHRVGPPTLGDEALSTRAPQGMTRNLEGAVGRIEDSQLASRAHDG